jgi:hypothetical protein
MRIQELKTIYICPDHNDKYKARKQHMETLLKTNGFINTEHYKSGTENYPKCLLYANIDILQKNIDEPILLIEDDVEFTGVSEFDFIEDADAIYFGLSRSAGHPTENRDQGWSSFAPFSDTQVRVLNMLTTHAILYISKQYKQAVINALTEKKDIKYYNDVIISRLQPHYKVLANKQPSFYQAAKFNTTDHEEKWTKFVIS